MLQIIKLNFKYKFSTSDHEGIRNLIFDLLKTEILKFTYHPLGFIEAKFFTEEYIDDIKTQHEYRLHFWPYTTELGDISSIHNHSYDFNSVILNGQIQNVIYKIDNCSFEHGKLFNVRFTNNIFNLIADKEHYFISDSASTHYKSGDFYSMRKEDYHNNYAKINTITLVEIPPQKREPASIYVENEISDKLLHFVRNPLPDKENKEILALISTLLKQ